MAQHRFPLNFTNIEAEIYEMDVILFGERKKIPVFEMKRGNESVRFSLPQFQVLMSQRWKIDGFASVEWNCVLGPEDTEIYGLDYEFSDNNDLHKAIAFGDNLSNELNSHVIPLLESYPRYYSGLHVVCQVNDGIVPYTKMDNRADKTIGFRYCFYGRETAIFVKLSYEVWQEILGMRAFIDDVLRRIGKLPIIPGLEYSDNLHIAFNILGGLVNAANTTLLQKRCWGCREDQPGQMAHDCLTADCYDIAYAYSRDTMEFLNDSLGKAVMAVGICEALLDPRSLESIKIVEGFANYKFTEKDIMNLDLTYGQSSETLEFAHIVNDLIANVEIE